MPVANYTSGMRLLPKCTEGFRRISIVLALSVGLGFFCKWVHEVNASTDALHNLCAETYVNTEDTCYSKNDDATCIKNAEADLNKCFATPKITESLPYWGMFLIGAAFLAYLTALFTRILVNILGWVRDGFTKRQE